MVDLSLDLDTLSPTYLDLQIVNGDLVLTNDADPNGTNPILQAILQELRFGLSEWFLDNTQGFPWIQQVFAKGTSEGDIDALVQNKILSVPGVTALVEYESELLPEARGISVSFKAQTTSGTVVWTGTLSPTGG